jgi:nitrile hydratase
MNGAHDLGGMHGFGPVEIEVDEPPFHSAWERRAFAITLATGYVARWNVDEVRHAREQMPPAEYLATSYYEHWLFGLERLLAERGLVTRSELEDRVADATSPAGRLDGVEALDAASIARRIRDPRAARSDAASDARHRVGDIVMTRTINPVGHTRLPRYARGKRGSVEIDHGVWVYPDASGNGLGPAPQHCYAVRFEARELWGDDAPGRDSVYLDLWDDHLEPA